MVLVVAASAFAAPPTPTTSDRAREARGGVVNADDFTLRPAAPVADSAVVVTHHAARFDLISNDVAPARLDLVIHDLLGTPAGTASAIPALDRWSTEHVDTSGLCGMSATFAWALASSSVGPQAPVRVRDLRFGGEPCPQFVDADADGRCPQGRDLDDDGLCVSDGEVEESGTRMDCNDTARGPGCLTLLVQSEGDHTELIVVGATPEAPVWFFGAPRRGTSCPPTLGGVCIDLATPKSLGIAMATHAGTASLSIPGAAEGFYQAGMLALGMDSDFSPAVAATGIPAAREPTTEP